MDLRQSSVLILGLVATAIGQSLIFAILAPLGREVNLGELQITSIIAISALIFALASPWWGRFSDRVGRKPVIITGLAGYTVGTLVFTSVFYAGLAGALSGLTLYAVLLLARCSQSIVMSATSPASTAYAADHSAPTTRTRTMARLGTANSLGTILGPAVSGALAAFGLLAPLYFAAGLAALAGVAVWRFLPPTPKEDLTARNRRYRLRFTDPRVRHYLLSATGLFVGYSGIQQTLGFQLQDKLGLSGIATAQLTGAALMISAVFTFTSQMTLMQRLNLSATQFLRLGLVAMLFGAAIIAAFDRFAVLAVGMAFIGVGMGVSIPAVAAGASLAVSTEEQGAVAGLVSACPAMGFVAGPIIAGFLYQIHGPLAALFSAFVFFVVLVLLTLHERR
ncbi:MFS transporter [Parahaliea maris]|uniref:MFS transporter n=1 Tax=Parahaliea maris TaxID=2716870 RepID=A0A5C9A9E3_9GAMM|nr:MFS transporter [Parahaliea maris]